MGGFLRAVGGYLRPYWGQVLLVLLAISPGIAFYTLQPLVFRAIIDDAILARDMHRLGQLMLLLFSLVALRLVGEVAKEYCGARLGAAVMNSLRLKMFDHLQCLSLDFYGRIEAGDLLFRYTNDLAAI